MEPTSTGSLPTGCRTWKPSDAGRAVGMAHPAHRSRFDAIGLWWTVGEPRFCREGSAAGGQGGSVRSGSVRYDAPPLPPRLGRARTHRRVESSLGCAKVASALPTDIGTIA